jgi:hypothetical protein
VLDGAVLGLDIQASRRVTLVRHGVDVGDAALSQVARNHEGSTWVTLISRSPDPV